jgi:hypothetical protein
LWTWDKVVDKKTLLQRSNLGSNRKAQSLWRESPMEGTLKMKWLWGGALQMVDDRLDHHVEHILGIVA